MRPLLVKLGMFPTLWAFKDFLGFLTIGYSVVYRPLPHPREARAESRLGLVGPGAALGG